MGDFFIDSNIIIEAFKRQGLQDARDIWICILRNYTKHNFYINVIIKNEVVFHLYTKRKLVEIEELKEFLNTFSSLEINKKVEGLMFSFIEKYDLKPNDALILATCKYYGITYLISLDSDFTEPCKKEGIVLISSDEKLKEMQNY